MANQVSVPELGRRMDKVEERLAEDVVDARLFAAEMRAIRDAISGQERVMGSLEAKLDAAEKDRKNTEREQTKALKTLLGSVLVTVLSVMLTALVMLFQTGVLG